MKMKKHKDMSREACLKRAEHRLLFLLEKRDYTYKQLQDKLRRGGYTEDVISEALEYVNRLGFINDRAYAARYIEAKKSRKSLRCIESELYNRGIDRETVKSCLEEAGEIDETEGIRRLLEKRHYDAETAGYEERQKQFAYLSQKGYRPADIRLCLES